MFLNRNMVYRTVCACCIMQSHYSTSTDDLQNVLEIFDLTEIFPHLLRIYLHFLSKRYLGNIHI